MIAEVIDSINAGIALKMEKYPCLDGFRLYGLSEQILRRYSDDEWIPVVIDKVSESHNVFIDDDYPLGLYHRLLQKTYSEPQRKNQYGDDIVQTVIADMILVCWAIREQVNTTADVLESIIYSSFDKKAFLTQSNFDRRTVFSGEFSGVPFNVPENVLLFSIRYRFKYPATARQCLEIENFCK